MGAGCGYHSKETGKRVFWIDLYPSCDYPEQEWEYEQDWEGLMYTVQVVLNSLNWHQHDQYEYFNGLYRLYLETTYDADGLVFRLEPDMGSSTSGLALYHWDGAHRKLAKAIIKEGYSLRIASGAYTSTEFNPK